MHMSPYFRSKHVLHTVWETSSHFLTAWIHWELLHIIVKNRQTNGDAGKNDSIIFVHKKKGRQSQTGRYRIEVNKTAYVTKHDSLALTLHERTNTCLINLTQIKGKHKANHVSETPSSGAKGPAGFHASKILPLTIFIHISICGFAGIGASFSS